MIKLHKLSQGSCFYPNNFRLQALVEQGVKAGDGNVLVTGATGGVGSVAILLLSQLGYQVNELGYRINRIGYWVS